MVWKGLTIPVPPAPVLAYWPVTKGTFCADDDLGLFVVQRQQVGRGQDVAVAVGLQVARQKAQGVDAVDLSVATRQVAGRLPA